MEITVDTHSLVWYADEGLNHRLSKHALHTIEAAEKNGMVYIPVIVMTELMHLIEKKRVNLDFHDLLGEIENNSAYRIVSLDTEVLKIAANIKGQETHDRLILATAVHMKTPLVSKDARISDSSFNVIW